MGAARRSTHHKDNSELLDHGPFQGVVVGLVGGIGGGRLGALDDIARVSLLDKGVGDEVVDYRGVHGGVGARPEDDTGGGYNLKGVQHCD